VNVTVTERNTGTPQLRRRLFRPARAPHGSRRRSRRRNIFGTGNLTSFQINNGRVNKVYSLSYVNPYWTNDGVSRGFDLLPPRRGDTSSLSVAAYHTYSTGLGRALRRPR